MKRVRMSWVLGWVLVAVLGTSTARPVQGLPVILLENTSSVGFKAAVIGMSLGGPGSCCDIRFGDTDPPTPLFMYGGAPISASNPPPPGETAFTGPHASFGNGDYVEFIEVQTNAPSSPGFSWDTGLSVEIVYPAETVVPFDIAHGLGVQIVGAFRIVDESQVPEPGTLALLGAGLAMAALGGGRRSSRR